jgi:hypothetical protein
MYDRQKFEDASWLSRILSGFPKVAAFLNNVLETSQGAYLFLKG